MSKAHFRKNRLYVKSLATWQEPWWWYLILFMPLSQSHERLFPFGDFSKKHELLKNLFSVVQNVCLWHSVSGITSTFFLQGGFTVRSGLLGEASSRAYSERRVTPHCQWHQLRAPTSSSEAVRTIKVTITQLTCVCWMLRCIILAWCAAPAGSRCIR